MHLAILYWELQGKPSKIDLLSRCPATTAQRSGRSGSRAQLAAGVRAAAREVRVAPPRADIRARRSTGRAGIRAAPIEAAILRAAANVAGFFVEPMSGVRAAAVDPPEGYLRRRELRPLRGALSRRGHHGVRPHRRLVRGVPLGRDARHDHLREGVTAAWCRLRHGRRRVPRSSRCRPRASPTATPSRLPARLHRGRRGDRGDPRRGSGGGGARHGRPAAEGLERSRRDHAHRGGAGPGAAAGHRARPGSRDARAGARCSNAPGHGGLPASAGS